MDLVSQLNSGPKLSEPKTQKCKHCLKELPMLSFEKLPKKNVGYLDRYRKICNTCLALPKPDRRAKSSISKRERILGVK